MLGFFLWHGVEFCNPWLAQKQCAYSGNDDCKISTWLSIFFFSLPQHLWNHGWRWHLPHLGFRVIMVPMCNGHVEGAGSKDGYCEPLRILELNVNTAETGLKTVMLIPACSISRKITSAHWPSFCRADWKHRPRDVLVHMYTRTHTHTHYQNQMVGRRLGR